MAQRDLTGSILAGCRIEGLLGRGAMGEVWRGTQLALRRPVALKVITVEPRDAALEEALLGEARALARVEDLHVVKVYDVRLETDALCMILELLEGRTLASKIAEDGPLPEPELLDVAAGVARGLAAIHRAGLVHRDLKLDNVVLSDAGAVKITDFGLAVARGGRDGYAGCIVGTPPYISPEQWLERPIDGRADLYALGVLLYACATGNLPFRGKSPADYKEAHLKTRIPDPRKSVPDLDPGVAAVIVKLLRKDRNKRYAGVGELLEDLDLCRRGEPPRALPAEAPAASGPLELGLRPNEFHCPACRSVVERGARACPGCAKGFCCACLTTLAAAAGLCAPCAKAAGPRPR